MPLYPSSFFIPPAAVPFLLEDKYVRGGFMCLPSATDRDALHIAVRKSNMVVVTQDDGKAWTLGADTSNAGWIEWNPLASGSALQAPLAIGGDGKIGIDAASATVGHVLTVNSSNEPVWAPPPGAGSGSLPLETTGSDGDVLSIVSGSATWTPPPSSLPATGSEGELLTVVSGNPAWAPAPASFVPTRRTFQHTTASALSASGGQEDFQLNQGKVSLVYELTVSHADIRIEAHSTPARTDSNPYTFLSTASHLSDDGTYVMEDLSVRKDRRYAFVVNLENTPSGNIYWRIINENASSVQPTVDIGCLTLEE